MESYLSLLGAVAPVLLLVWVGFAVRRARWVSVEADNSLLRLSVNLLAPALIIDSMVGNPALRKVSNLLLPPLVGFATVALGFGLAYFVARRLALPTQKEERTFAFATGIYNYGYIAIPLIQTLFGRETMGVLFVHNLGVEIAFWSVGVLLLTGHTVRGVWRNLLNGPMIAMILALVLNFSGAQLPPFLARTTQMLGQTAIPLALILTGATLSDLLAKTSLHSALPVISGGVFLRLLILPLLFLLLAQYLPCSNELKRVIVVQAAMPAAMMPIIISKHYDGAPVIATQVVVSTTLLGLLTIPFWIKMGFYFVGQFK